MTLEFPTHYFDFHLYIELTGILLLTMFKRAERGDRGASLNSWVASTLQRVVIWNWKQLYATRRKLTLWRSTKAESWSWQEVDSWRLSAESWYDRTRSAGYHAADRAVFEVSSYHILQFHITTRSSFILPHVAIPYYHTLQFHITTRCNFHDTQLLREAPRFPRSTITAARVTELGAPCVFTWNFRWMLPLCLNKHKTTKRTNIYSGWVSLRKAETKCSMNNS